MDCIAVLAEAGCDTAARDDAGQTELMVAVQEGRAAAVLGLIKVAELEAKDNTGNTAFHHACLGAGAGHTDAAE